MYCVCIVIKHPKNCSQVILFIGEPQNLTKLGYHLSFGLKDLIYVKIRAHRALARLGPALAHSKKQITESGMGTALERPPGPLERAYAGSAPSLLQLVSSVLSFLPFFNQLQINF